MSEVKNKDALRMSNEEAQKLSRECLQTALFKLMGQKKFDDIFISEIVKLAGVSRNAFYRNYKTKEALLEGLSETITARLKEALPKSGHADAAAYTRFFQMVSNNADLFQILLSARASLADRLMRGDKSYREIAWEGALSQITIRWFETGMQERPSEMGKLCYELLSKLQSVGVEKGCGK